MVKAFFLVYIFLKMKQDAFSLVYINSTKKDILKTNIVPKYIRSYVSSFCNFYSWFLIFPYKITWDQSSARFIVTSSKKRKICCDIAHTIAAVSTTPYLVGFIYNMSRGMTDPTFLLTSVANMLCYLTTFEFLLIIWKKSNLLVEAANWHLKIGIFSYPASLYKIGYICLFPLLMFLLQNPLAGIVNEIIGDPCCTGQAYNPSTNTNTALLTNTSINIVIFCPLYFVFYGCSWYAHLYYLASTGLMLALILSIKMFVLEMVDPKGLKLDNAGEALLQGVKMDTDIRNLLNTFNSIMGRKVLLEYLMMLSFYATILEYFSQHFQGSWLSRVHIVIYLIFSGIFWIEACEVHFLVRNYLKEWTNIYRSTFLLQSPQALKQYPNCLLAIGSEADSNPAAVSCRCFNVTYGFLGSMLGLIITYSTIVHQMKADKQLNA